MAEMKLLEQKCRASLDVDIRILVRYRLLRQHTVNLLRRQFEMGIPYNGDLHLPIYPVRVRSRNISLPNAALSFLVGSLSKNIKAV